MFLVIKRMCLFYGCKITTYYSNRKMFQYFSLYKSVYFTLKRRFLTVLNTLNIKREEEYA